MIKFDLLLKRMWTVLAVLFCTVVSAQAAAITYQLTTHVDGRTITASKSVSAGASLIDNMPQQLWRASTTYKFYADADLTEEITEAPAEDATVYVDYEFNPPFAVAENTTDGPYYTLRGFYANGDPYYFYADGNKVDAIVGSIEGLRNQDQAKWAYIGDGFSLNLYNKATGTWLAFGQSDPTMQANPLEKGWQLYSNNYVNPHYPEVSAYFMLAVPSADESLKNNTQIFGVSNMSGRTTLDHPGGSGSVALDNKGHWNEQGVWQYGQDKISWASLFGTLQEGVLTIWHVEYRIFDEDNNLIDQKFYDKENEAKAVDYYYQVDPTKYYGFGYYHDADFTEVWEPNDENDKIPATGTTIVYVKVITHNYIAQPWKTFVIPFDIEDLAAHFGEDFEGVPAVDVLEFKEIQDGLLTSNAAGDFYRCKLIFNPVTAIEAYKPYMFRVNRVDEKIINEMYAAEGQDPCEVTTVDDPANPGISVSMEGTLNDNGYNMDASDGLHFYFGYDQNANAYNFYRVSANIPRNRCWFYVNDNRPSGAKLNVSFDFNVITGIDKTVVSSKAADGKIYNINGQQVQNTLQKGIYIVNGKKVIVK